MILNKLTKCTICFMILCFKKKVTKMLFYKIDKMYLRQILILTKMTKKHKKNFTKTKTNFAKNQV